MGKNISFIGCGNMAQAMISGVVGSKLVASDKVIASDYDAAKLEDIKKLNNINITQNNKECAAFGDIIILCVKPIHIIGAINEIKDSIKEDTIIVSIAAGVTIKDIEDAFGKPIKLVRVMPNTPALVGEGMSALCKNKNVLNDEFEEIVKIFESFGKADVIEERLIDAVVGVSGSSPAYVYMFIEALADGAVLEGLPRDKALKMAAQSVLGSAKMVLESGKHPGELKDNVCSPGGTTIEAVYSLERDNFRGAVIAAVHAASEKNRKMSKK